MALRWNNYLLKEGEKYKTFWQNYLTHEKKVLFILGGGFDPRMCFCLDLIMNEDCRAKLDCLLLNLDGNDVSLSPDLQSRVVQNNSELKRMMVGRGTLKEEKLKMEDETGRAIGSRSVVGMFNDYNFDRHTDIIVDISSLPLDVYFPLIGKILNILDERRLGVNLHVVVAENVRMDQCIKNDGLSDEATYLYRFGGNLELESEAINPLVWIPILGEDQSAQLEPIKDLTRPSEICPVLPSPSIDPRRGDKILLENRDLLDRLSIESGNIIYASEQNPFEVYRQINKTVEYYRTALRPLGDARFAISPLSGKLMSMGALLVAYEEGISNKKTVGIAYVESSGYTMQDNCSDLMPQCKPFSLWIFGDCYNRE